MTLCPLCRSFPRFKVRVARVEEGSDRTGERQKLFATACWIFAALERTRPCRAHQKTLREARNLTEGFVQLVD